MAALPYSLFCTIRNRYSAVLWVIPKGGSNEIRTDA